MQNSIIEIYFSIFINYINKNLARLLSIVEFTYNNVKNKSIK